MVRAYNQSAATLNLLRAFAQGGYADLHQVNAGTSTSSPTAPGASATRTSPTGSTRRWTSWRPAASPRRPTPQIRETNFFTSHEALLLHYEEALTRVDS